ncbi:hypothetical protein BJV78DRAFT_1155693 [Lactifluus subvellereus]|nr:hypothetical protein BJV78DRAFT_1155693 [Lactifluus subvellereus]
MALPLNSKAPKSPFLKRAIDCLHSLIFHPTCVLESDSSNKTYEASNSGGLQPQSYVRSLQFCLCAAGPELTNLGYQEEGEEERNLGEKKMEQKKVRMGQKKKVKESRFSKRKSEVV